MSEWVRVAGVAEIPQDTGKEVVAGPHVVALFRRGDQIYALDGICPHAGGPLAEGRMTGEVVTCPWHGWQFDVTTGVQCLNRRIQHRTFPVQISGDDVLIDIAAPAS